LVLTPSPKIARLIPSGRCGWHPSSRRLSPQLRCIAVNCEKYSTRAGGGKEKMTILQHFAVSA